jgi:[acyl-carrier-protein] S-malonyltransferase
MNTAFLFPGQGAQFVGMGKEVADAYPAAAKVFETANSLLGYDLAQICFEGPADRLSSTVVSQPAIFVTSAAILEAVRSTAGGAALKPQVAAGLSLGEYTALYAAGVIDFAEGLRLVQKRGEAMQAAADATEGTMVSIIGLDAEKVNQICCEAAEGQMLAAVNFNCPGQIVVSGARAACARARVLAERYGAIKAVELGVAGAFHTEMMAPAAQRLRDALQTTSIREPDQVKTIANISAEYYTSARQIRQGLVQQLVRPILWQKCMEKLISDGVQRFYEIGPGRVLTGLMKRINRKAQITSVGCAEDIRAVV